METSGACYFEQNKFVLNYFDAYADDGFLLLLASFFYRNFDNKSQNIVKCVLTMEKFNNFM